MKKISKILLSIILIMPMLIKAEEVNTTYKGEYSLDYLLRNYNAITFEMNDNPTYDFIKNLKKENVNFNIEGPVLINGDYYNDDYSSDGLTYAMKNPTNAISYINGTKKDYVSTSSKVSINKNFINFDKLYKQILAESKTLVEKTEFNINNKDIIINKPGIYQINSTRLPYENFTSHDIPTVDAYSDIEIGDILVKSIYIDNYNPNAYYIINNMKTFELDNYYVLIKNKEDDTFKYLDEFIDSENYTGNIIFNYPNARFIYSIIQAGKIIAPNADVFIDEFADAEDSISNYEEDIKSYHDTIIANSVKSGNNEKYDENNEYEYVLSNINFFPYTSSKKIEFAEGEIVELKDNEDFQDDIYTGSYSIGEILGNYNVVSLGQKDYETNTTFYKKEQEVKGNTSIFHIAGQFLINGDINSGRLDLESNKVNESFYGDRWIGYDYYYNNGSDSIQNLRYKSWGDGETLSGSNSVVFNNNGLSRSFIHHEYETESEYINFERLYNKIVEEQKEIKQGILVTPVDGVAHIEVGENYYIEDINQINEIVFDNFGANSEKMTVITVLNKDYINFPKISQSNAGSYVPTKDYFGKSEPMFEYEYYNFPDDIYAGNIIWNVPDSKYISFETQTPIIGHLVAPNADVEMKETHFAGGFIVNSLYAEGNSEAHFYPLQPVDIPENYDCFVANTNYFNGKWYTDETVLVVNPTAKDVLEPPKEPEQPKEEISNPKTGQVYTITFVLLLITLTSIISLIFIKKKKTIIN